MTAAVDAVVGGESLSLARLTSGRFADRFRFRNACSSNGEELSGLELDSTVVGPASLVDRVTGGDLREEGGWGCTGKPECVGSMDSTRLV